jgi:hypothetical protein
VRRKLLVLAIATIVLYGGGVAIDTAIDLNIGGATLHPDMPLYKNRTQTILDGGLIYRDTGTETPPIINYILVPAELMGGGQYDWMWGLYFSLFAYLTSILLYLSLRRWDELRAFQVGFVTLILPFMLFESVTGEDESIMVFIFFVAVVLMLYERKVPAAIAIGVGIWTKMFSILLLPIQFLRLKSWKDRAVLLAIVAAATVLVTIYFLLSCYDDFIFFLRFYFLGESGRESGGISMWHFLQTAGYGVPKELELAIVLVSLLAAYLYCNKRGFGVWQSITLVVLVFIVVYPKMHTGYYILPCILLSIWGVEDRRILLRTFLAFIPIMTAAGFSVQDGGEVMFDFPGSWIVGFLLALLGTLLFLDAGRIASKARPFISREPQTLSVDGSDDR